MKVIKKIWWLPLVVYMIGMPSFISERVYNELCSDIRISIVDSAEYTFITPADIMTILYDNNIEFRGIGLNSINLEAIEELLSELRELESVEVYTTADGLLHIDADQRDPVMRIITAYGNNYYIDKYGHVVPHRNLFTPHIIVVTGNIEVPDSCIMGKSILELSDNALIRKTFNLVRFINDDEFWSSMIEQVYVNEKHEYELVPRLGSHIVRFGSINDYEWKLKVLRTFYTQTMPLAGWDRYEEIDMRFNGQLVCRKK